MNQIVAVVAIICCVGNVFGYQTGAPPSQCVDMTPAVPPTGPHGTGQTTSSSPYIITTNASTGYTPGQTYSVTISKGNAGDTNFKGFLCQIRQVGQTTALGTFSVRDASKSKTIACTSSKGAVTHINRSPVENQIFDWTAPFVPLGVNTAVQAVCTVVQQLSTLWIQLKSEPFQELALPAGEVRTNPPTTEPPSMPPIPLDFSGCGSQTLCYRDPTGCVGPGDCKYALIVQYDKSTERLTFYLASNAGGFAAVGFSTDSSMGMDDVIGCQRDPNNNLVYGKDCWNPNGRNPNQYDTDQNSTVSINGIFMEGAVVCRIVRVLTPADTTEDYDLSQLYRLLFARGSGRGGSFEGLAMHSVVPVISDKAVNITVPQIIGVEGKPLIKAHGILMTFAWIGAAPTGIFLARYFKVVWPNGNWFHAHRAHTITALVLTIIGIIIIFVEAGEWVYNSSNKGTHNAHPIIGFIVAVGATVQPIMAAFRPHPGTPKRPIFNHAHYLVGVVTLSLGIDAVILGLIFARDKHLTGLSNVASSVLYAWIGLQLSVWIAMEVIAYKYRKRQGCAGTCSTDKSGGIEMKSHKDSDDPNSAPDKQPSEDAHIRKSLLITFVILNVGMSLIIAIYIGIADV